MSAEEDAGAAPLLAPAWGTGGLPPDGRVDALNNFANVCTFIAGFALADLGGMDWDPFPPLLGEAYVTLMSFASGCAALNAVLGILLVVVCQRLKVWDETNTMKYQENNRYDRAHNNKNHAAFVRAFGDPGGDSYSKCVFKAIYDGERAPMHYSIQLFPWAVVSYISAVTVKVIAAAWDTTSTAYALGATSTIMVLFAAPMVYYGRKMLALVVA